MESFLCYWGIFAGVLQNVQSTITRNYSRYEVIKKRCSLVSIRKVRVTHSKDASIWMGSEFKPCAGVFGLRVAQKARETQEFLRVYCHLSVFLPIVWHNMQHEASYW
jgi:hypothetical protein